MPIKETVGREFPSSGEPWACVLNDSTLGCLLYRDAGPGWRIETEESAHAFGAMPVWWVALRKASASKNSYCLSVSYALQQKKKNFHHCLTNILTLPRRLPDHSQQSWKYYPALVHAYGLLSHTCCGSGGEKRGNLWLGSLGDPLESPCCWRLLGQIDPRGTSNLPACYQPFTADQL